MMKADRIGFCDAFRQARQETLSVAVLIFSTTAVLVAEFQERGVRGEYNIVRISRPSSTILDLRGFQST